MEILFKTPHGSRLYGMAHATSDEDWYTVVVKPPTKKKKYSTHKIIDNDDSVVVDLGTWLTLCDKGVPQALEAMFSEQSCVDKLSALRAGYRAGPAAYDTYLRTIKSFAMQDEFKPKRHALRLALNLREIRGRGRFNPTLEPHQVDILSNWATIYDAEECYRRAKELAWSY